MFDTTPFLDCAGHKLLLDRPRVMGIVNITPDSFADGGNTATYRLRSPTPAACWTRAPTSWISAASPRDRARWPSRCSRNSIA